MKVHHIAITVDNLDESIHFYTQVLGFELKGEFERDDLKGKAAFLEAENMQIELWEFEDAKSPEYNLEDIKVRGIRHIAFEVEDLDKSRTDLAEKGLELSEPKMGASGHRYSFATDPSGVALEFYEIKKSHL